MSSDSQLLLVVVSVAAGIAAALYFLLQGAGKRQKTFLPRDDFVAVPLIEKEELSHDVSRFTFQLPSDDMALGLPIGQHLTLRCSHPETGKPVQRSYTPVTDSSTLGKFSLVVKVYKPLAPKFPNGGVMSQHLDSLKIGDTVLVKGPKGHLEYHGKGGQFHFKPLGKPAQDRSCEHICMMAGGTGITPMYQILQYIFRTNGGGMDAQVTASLLFANQSPQDVLLKEELDQLEQDFPGRFSVWYTVDRVDGEDWKYDTGFIGKDMIAKRLIGHETSKKLQFFMCGPPPMIKFACTPNLTALGYSDKDWVVF